MADLIDRQAAIKVLKNERSDWNDDYNTPIDFCIDAIYRIPAAHPDIKIGKWIEDVAFYDEDGNPCIVTRCNQCGEPNPVSNFCPECGAKMEGED